MRVLLVHPHIPIYGGAEFVVVKLASYLTKKGIPNAVLTLYVSPDIPEISKDLHFVTCTDTFSYKARQTSFINAIGLINEIIALRKLVRRNIDAFDVVNIHNFPATWSTFPMHKPCVWMCNELPDLHQNPNPSIPLKMLRNTVVAFDKLIVNKYMNLICAADEVSAGRIKERYGRQSEVVHYGIDYDFLSSGDGREFLQKFDLLDNFVVSQVGFIEPQKNQLESIRAIKKLKEHIPNIKLVLAGAGNYHPYGKMLKKYVHEKKLEKYVLFTGHLTRELVRDLYHACDVFVSPVIAQGGWLAPFEALCAAKPIVISPSMTAASIVTKEKLGLVTKDLAKSIKNIHDNPRYYNKMAKKGRRFVAENLSWDAFCHKMLAVFEKALALLQSG